MSGLFVMIFPLIVLLAIITLVCTLIMSHKVKKLQKASVFPLDMMPCPNCGELVDARIAPNQTAFCPNCGFNLNQNKESFPQNDIKFCGNCGNKLSENSIFCDNCGHKVQNEITTESLTIKSPQNTEIKRTKRKRNIFIFLTVLLWSMVVFVIALIGYSFYIDNISNETEQKQNISSQQEYVQYDTDVKENEQADIEENTENVILNIIDTPTYYRLESSEYSYYIDIPTHFIEDKHSDIHSRIFYSPDETAGITVIVNENSDKKTSDELLQDMINDFGDSITYKANGDGWLAMSATDNGISTYHKIFVKDYIYTFRFTCDEEYVDVYKNYIEHIEDNFKTTN